MAFKKRKDPNGGLTERAKFERQLALRKTIPKPGDTNIQSIGGPVSSVEDVERCFEYYKTTQQIDFPDGVKEQMIEDYLLDSFDKQHLVFNCLRVSDGYEWRACFISDKQVEEMTKVNDVFQQNNN
jgi:hypothetical protein